MALIMTVIDAGKINSTVIIQEIEGCIDSHLTLINATGGPRTERTVGIGVHCLLNQYENEGKFMKTEIILYQDVDFGGKKLELTQSETSLVGFGFNGIVSSVYVESGSWTVYDKENFCGPAYNLQPGKYPNPESWNGKDDEIASVKVLES